MSAGAVPVVAAVVRRGGRYLLGRRPEHKRHGGLWEFPGGKLHEGEDFLAAARRELAEELDLEALGVGVELAAFADPDSSFRIHFVEVEVAGTPRPHEHTAVGWYTPAELADLELAPADRAFADTLQGAERRGRPPR